MKDSSAEQVKISMACNPKRDNAVVRTKKRASFLFNDDDDPLSPNWPLLITMLRAPNGSMNYRIGLTLTDALCLSISFHAHVKGVLTK